MRGPKLVSGVCLPVSLFVRITAWFTVELMEEHHVMLERDLCLQNSESEGFKHREDLCHRAQAVR